MKSALGEFVIVLWALGTLGAWAGGAVVIALPQIDIESQIRFSRYTYRIDTYVYQYI